MVRLSLSLQPRFCNKPHAPNVRRIIRALLPVSPLCAPRLRSAFWLLCSFVVACVIFSVPSIASLHVRDDAPHAEQWFRLYNELPDVWKTRRVIKLRELPPREMERLVAKLDGDEADRNGDSVVDGCYQSGDEDEDTPIITLCETLRGEQAALVFAHEYGHFVWGELLTDSERARYTRLWRTQKRAHHLVTRYAGDSDEEGFAEAFAYSLRRPAQLQKRDSASLQFCRDLVENRQSK